ncbi:hypothetical protein HMPREF0262_01593 [Clostridium sp. ATCC 29733]|nr:hypothetical protein HMPREF0262_01593 [Clostridium sp. ATCC 29733]
MSLWTLNKIFDTQPSLPSIIWYNMDNRSSTLYITFLGGV